MKPLAEWPLAARRGIRGVFTDIDDTLTTHGAITADALQALADLKAAGLMVIPITGRSIGWCQTFAQGDAVRGSAAWPADAFVAENGGVAWIAEASGGIPLNHKIYAQSATIRARNRARMRAVTLQVLAQVPGAQLARDSDVRETDIAFDYREFANLSQAEVAQVVAILQSAGMQTTVSSIHIHGCFGNFNKWEGARWIIHTLTGQDLARELDHWVFVGDSGNDQPMFERFIHSVGVANIGAVADQLSHLPRYVTPSARGAGFAEVAAALLESHA